ncbi:hypothetical protein P691DRAFT_766702 [Macrolepiota fuliginosa MF-IS2]|uniref:Uncharacterized protein n=1 Tax=Macrolepiota fuliginosa MF-IS2 TaxID=1400762 RepID=A0A9P5WYC3_9AGAR|nr:hypothetical protein P691DRAFT_766702 [Macrolepiota fuliginosa MF-IS2]
MSVAVVPASMGETTHVSRIHPLAGQNSLMVVLWNPWVEDIVMTNEAPEKSSTSPIAEESSPHGMNRAVIKWKFEENALCSMNNQLVVRWRSQKEFSLAIGWPANNMSFSVAGLLAWNQDEHEASGGAGGEEEPPSRDECDDLDHEGESEGESENESEGESVVEGDGDECEDDEDGEGGSEMEVEESESEDDRESEVEEDTEDEDDGKKHDPMEIDESDDCTSDGEDDGNNGMHVLHMGIYSSVGKKISKSNTSASHGYGMGY